MPSGNSIVTLVSNGDEYDLPSSVYQVIGPSKDSTWLVHRTSRSKNSSPLVRAVDRRRHLSTPQAIVRFRSKVSSSGSSNDFASGCFACPAEAVIAATATSASSIASTRAALPRRRCLRLCERVVISRPFDVDVEPREGSGRMTRGFYPSRFPAFRQGWGVPADEIHADVQPRRWAPWTRPACWARFWHRGVGPFLDADVRGPLLDHRPWGIVVRPT